MNYLYVCHFSNGHIKVGRSINPMARIASHEDRVSCLGVELVEHRIFECVGHVVPAEAELIRRCGEAASKTNKNEWFEGLDFLEACDLAHVAASLHFEDPIASDVPVGGILKAKAIDLLGGSIGAASKEIGVSYQAISKWPDVLPARIADRVLAAVARKKYGAELGLVEQKQEA